MNPEEVESQLSAMFDGELPASECQLLSRRIDREEALRARWSRYAMIGATMRSEPVIAARHGFAQRVSVAITHEIQPRRVQQREAPVRLRHAALAAALVVGVAGLSVLMLRDVSLPTLRLARSSTLAVPATFAASVASKANASASREPSSYVTPQTSGGAGPRLQTQLADFVLSHSEYSTPLVRRNVLSSLVGSEQAADAAPANSSATDEHQDAADDR